MDNFEDRAHEPFSSSSHQSADASRRPIVTNGGSQPNPSLYEQRSNPSAEFDFDYINTIACIAVYDTRVSTPKIVKIPGGPTHTFIEDIASATYSEVQAQGGLIPYTVIREIVENFIHAYFREPVVSIFDQGNTITFADQGPGIQDKDRVQLPGFTSANEQMKKYIRGVGSGLPLVKEILGFSHGTMKIEDNVNKGAVITISMLRNLNDEKPVTSDDIPTLTENDKIILRTLLPAKTLGVTDIRNLTGLANASIHASFKKLEEADLLELVKKKRKLTDKGIQVALSL